MDIRKRFSSPGDEDKVRGPKERGFTGLRPENQGFPGNHKNVPKLSQKVAQKWAQNGATFEPKMGTKMGPKRGPKRDSQTNEKGP